MKRIRLSALALALAACGAAHASTLDNVRFLIVDPETGKPVAGQVTVERDGHTATLPTSAFSAGETSVLNTVSMSVESASPERIEQPVVITIPRGTSVEIHQQSTQNLPVKDITIKVTATRLMPNRAPVATSGTTRTHEEITKFTNTTSQDTRTLTKGQAGVAQDSGGQSHVRGEHTDITYVVDGVPLPDTLSGRQGSVVVPSTIESIQILTGGFAPEFGGQTAAILNITTTPGSRKLDNEGTVQAGTYNTLNADFTSVGPIGKKASFVLNVGSNTTDAFQEAPQPGDDTAHNHATEQNYFGKLRLSPDSRDTWLLTLSANPGEEQVANRSGLPDAFESVGQGYGFSGLRNADGTRPDANSSNSNLLGAAPEVLPSQQASGMDINQSEQNNYAILSWQRKINSRDSAVLSFTTLRSSQNTTNNNPTSFQMALPVDNSIEYNPTVSRDITHEQGTGSYSATRGAHRLKAGFLVDAQSGTEDYQIGSASQLALDELAALDPALAPAGAVTGAKDIDGNPVYKASTNVVPTIHVKRAGSYGAAYIQDTWQVSRRFLTNFGVRYDVYVMNQDLGQPSVFANELSPRLNFEYRLDKQTDLRWSYNHLLNTPPLSQGALVGTPIEPEIINQYDVAIERQLARRQTLTLAYYYKQIDNQIDVGLLIPGSQIGLYSAVNLQQGAVHGIEMSYDIASPGNGWDAYTNLSYSSAMPNGLDNTGAQVPDYNDHDQRLTVGSGLAYTWKSGASAAATAEYGSGFASSVVYPNGPRVSHTEIDLHCTTGDHFFAGKGALTLDVLNLFDDQPVLNFQSAFTGTRFQLGRRVLLAASFKF